MKRTNRRRLLAAGALLALPGCGQESPPRIAEVMVAGAPAIVDSAMAPDLALARFRAGLGTAPAGLRGGRTSPDALIAEVVRALAASDTAAFESIAVDRAEFAYLYFPTSPVARKPYELPPGLAWMQIQETNRRSTFRSFGRYGGKDWSFAGYRCAPDRAPQGRNRIWSDCVVRMRAGTETVEARLVGGILERDGTFKVLSYATDG